MSEHLRGQTAPNSGNDGHIYCLNDCLVIRATQRVHNEISAFIDQLVEREQAASKAK